MRCGLGTVHQSNLLGKQFNLIASNRQESCRSSRVNVQKDLSIKRRLWLDRWLPTQATSKERGAAYGRVSRSRSRDPESQCVVTSRSSKLLRAAAVYLCHLRQRKLG
jgi:hypothetical protein